MYGGDNRCVVCGEHIADPHAIGCPSGDEPLFALTVDENPLWVVRNPVTGTIHAESQHKVLCDQWVDEHPNTRYVVVERVGDYLPFDEYVARGLLRNYPGEPKRKPADTQLALI